MFLRLFPRNEEYRSGSDVPRGTRVGTLPLKRGKVLDRPERSSQLLHISGKRVINQLAFGITLIALGPALVANSLCRNQEQRTMHKPGVQIGNSGLNLFLPLYRLTWFE
jgi:hypothetical protein